MRVLVVDDDETLRLSVRITLEEQGHCVDEAQDGQAAIEKVSQEHYDAVVLDVNMPK